MIPIEIRPAISLLGILGYSFLAFVITLLLTKPFVRFLHQYKIGKKLRVEAVDGGSASVFLTYHQAKAGTPTMGGVLIWGSVLLTVISSRSLSYFGQVDHSLLQRGQVYIPLGILLAFGILGAIDDYLNVSGQTSETSPALAKRMKICVFIMVLAIITGWLIALLQNPFTLMNDADWLWNVKVGSSALALTVALSLLLYFGGKRLDDFLQKILIGTGKQAGLKAWPKFFVLIAVSSIAAYWFYVRLKYQSIDIPFATTLGLESSALQLGWLYIPFFIFVVIGTANAVNVTDGLDGLAGGLLIIAFGAFALISYLSGLFVLAAFCGVIVGALAAFLWHNVPPALFYMGDTGSLALGGTLAVMAFMVNQVLVLPLIGFIFLVEMLSVIIQLTSKRLRNGKKVFISAPFHHHLEALNWGESKVTMRLWIIGVFTAFLGILVGIYG